MKSSILSYISPVDNSERQSGANPLIRFLGEGEKSIYSDIFRPSTFEDSFENYLTSVNAGVPGLGVEDRIKVRNEQEEVQQVIGKGAGINKRFARELKERGDIGKYATFHQRMVDGCNANRAGLYYANPEDLRHSPNLLASVALKADLGKPGRNTGTVILDVFDGKHPEGNPTNASMLYVVSPDGKDYESGDKFLDDVEKTATRMAIVLQKYNEEAIRENEKAGREVKPVIQTLRTCAFGAGGRHIHPDVSPEQVSQRIMSGIEKGIGRINRDALMPLTITEIELEDGGYGAFSKAGIKSFDGEKLVPDEWDAFQSGSYAVTSPDSQFDSEETGSKPWVAFESEFPNQQRVAQPKKPAPFVTPTTPQSHVLGSEPITLAQDEPVALQLDPNRPSSQLIEHLRACPQDLGPSLQANLGNNARITLVDIHNRLGDRPDMKRPDFSGKAHAIRKAMLTRALVNFYRKHAESDQANTNEGKQIPDHAVPLIEFGVLCTRPKPVQILRGEGTKFDAQDARDRMKKYGVPEGAATVITNATAGVRPKDSQLTLLDKVVMDVEQLEGMRLSDDLDVSKLHCYRSFQSEDARKEFVALCKEYRELLADQRELHCGGSGGLRINVGTDVEPEARQASYDQPIFRQQQENRQYLVAEQLSALKKHQHLGALYDYRESFV